MLRSPRVVTVLAGLIFLGIGSRGAQQPSAMPYVPRQDDRPTPVNGDEPGFQPIFDGETLTGWEGDPTYWRVEGGALTGEITPASVVKSNTFIIWRGGAPRDFELKLDYRITSAGNSGINYRSASVPDPVTPSNKFALRGARRPADASRVSEHSPEALVAFATELRRGRYTSIRRSASVASGLSRITSSRRLTWDRPTCSSSQRSPSSCPMTRKWIRTRRPAPHPDPAACPPLAHRQAT